MPPSVARNGLAIAAAAAVVFVVFFLAAAAIARAEPPAACVPKDGPDVCKQRCDAKSPESCAVLGIMYLRGDIGGKHDLAKAEPLLRRACDAKVPLGCGGLGSLYGVQGKFDKARALLERGCAMGDALSCESLGGQALGADGGKPPADIVAASRKANVYYKRACELGSGTACGFCAVFIVDKMVEGTAKEALDLYVKACSSGMAIACRQAAELLEKNTPESKELAAGYDAPRLTADLRKRACKLGDEKACPKTDVRK
jgi:TPR repeat protein